MCFTLYLLEASVAQARKVLQFAMQSCMPLVCQNPMVICLNPRLWFLVVSTLLVGHTNVVNIHEVHMKLTCREIAKIMFQALTHPTSSLLYPCALHTNYCVLFQSRQLWLPRKCCWLIVALMGLRLPTEPRVEGVRVQVWYIGVHSRSNNTNAPA